MGSLNIIEGENEESDVPASYEWVPSSDRNLPDGALEGGSDNDSRLYVARAELYGSLLPGKLPEGHNCYVSWNGEEREVETYEVLVANPAKLTWIDTYGDGEVPPNALVAGHTHTGEMLYIGRIKYMDMYIPGKIQPSEHGCYISYLGEEFFSDIYEVLCSQP